MAWDTTLVAKLRYIINDYDSTSYTYSDATLEKFILVAASQVLQDIQSGEFAVDFDDATIDPDPTSSSDYDWYSALVLLKAACMIARAELKKATLKGGYKVVDDRSTIDTTGAAGAAKESVNSFCGDYKEALDQFRRGNTGAGIAIVGPYVEYLGEQ